uniref:HTH cro/C1-type domain-containing protein n=1 Tax=Geobacter metallireducens TaxID=28232 RepID=A0A831UDS5_GEOME
MHELILCRLNKALDSLNFPPKNRGRNSRFAAETGYSTSHASGILGGKTEITEETLERLEYKLGIRRRWLETGEGEMFLDAKKEAEAFEGLPPELNEIYVRCLRGRSRDEQAKIMEKFVRAVAEIDLEKVLSFQPQSENGPEK